MTVASWAGETRTEPAADGRPRIQRQLQRTLFESVLGSQSISELLDGIFTALSPLVPPRAMAYVASGDNGPQKPADIVWHSSTAEGSDGSEELQAAGIACRRSGDVELRVVDDRIVVAAPVARQAAPPAAVVLSFDRNSPKALLVSLGQLVAAHLVMWYLWSGSRRHAQEARETAAVSELTTEVIGAEGFAAACSRLADQLQDYFGAQRVAVGWRTATRGPCRLIAVSGFERFDRRSSQARHVEAALDECVLLGQALSWPPAAGQVGHSALAHQRLARSQDGGAAISVPLLHPDRDAWGAILVLGDDSRMSADLHVLTAAAPLLTTALLAAKRLDRGKLGRLAAWFARTWYDWKCLLTVAAVAVILLAGLLPMPYRVRGDCRMEPLVRRYVAAPFEGTLEASRVKPGDVVKRGDVLARMDGREVRWKRAAVVADRRQAAKRRDAAQAAHDYAEQQIAALEVERLDLQIQLLDHRADHLDVRSPLPGIIVGGDLERAEGVPLTIGQTLFEISPLDRMLVEVAVADDDIRHVRPGQTLSVRLDAHPTRCWTAEVVRAQPRAEIRDDRNVFIVEAELDNSDRSLRPGMKGRAFVTTANKPLGWILLHKPWAWLMQRLSW